MKVAILPYGSVVYESNRKFKQSFPTEEEAVEYIREKEIMLQTNGGNEDE